MKYATISLLSLVLLTGCEKALSESAIKMTTPDIIIYDEVVRVQAAKEIEENKSPTLSMLVVDYGVMRDQTRAAKGETVNIGR